MSRLRVAPFLLLLALTLGTAAPAGAQALAVGTVVDGYTFNGTHFVWTDGSLWTRSWVAGGGYYSHGCYYPTPGYWQYHYAGSKPAAVTVEKVDEFGILAKAVAARDAVQSKIALNQQFIDAAYKLGFGPLHGVGGISYGIGANPLVGNFGIQTSTIYGHNVQSLGQTIDPFRVNLDQYFLQAHQLAQGAQDAARQAGSEFNGTVNLAADRAAQLSAISARRDAIVAFARLLDGPPVSTSSTYKFTVGPGGKITADPSGGTEQLPAPKDSLAARWNNSAQRCVACHYGQNGEKKDGGFSVAAYPTMSVADQANVIQRLTLPETDPKHMPKGEKPLTGDELKAWIDVMVQSRQPAAKPETMPKLSK